jgi:hypothetical protein
LFDHFARAFPDGGGEAAAWFSFGFGLALENSSHLLTTWKEHDAARRAAMEFCPDAGSPKQHFLAGVLLAIDPLTVAREKDSRLDAVLQGVVVGSKIVLPENPAKFKKLLTLFLDLWRVDASSSKDRGDSVWEAAARTIHIPAPLECCACGDVISRHWLGAAIHVNGFEFSLLSSLPICIACKPSASLGSAGMITDALRSSLNVEYRENLPAASSIMLRNASSCGVVGDRVRAWDRLAVVFLNVQGGTWGVVSPQIEARGGFPGGMLRQDANGYIAWVAYASALAAVAATATGTEVGIKGVERPGDWLENQGAQKEYSTNANTGAENSALTHAGSVLSPECFNSVKTPHSSRSTLDTGAESQFVGRWFIERCKREYFVDPQGVVKWRTVIYNSKPNGEGGSLLFVQAARPVNEEGDLVWAEINGISPHGHIVPIMFAGDEHRDGTFVPSGGRSSPAEFVSHREFQPLNKTLKMYREVGARSVSKEGVVGEYIDSQEVGGFSYSSILRFARRLGPEKAADLIVSAYSSTYNRFVRPAFKAFSSEELRLGILDGLKGSDTHRLAQEFDKTGITDLKSIAYNVLMPKFVSTHDSNETHFVLNKNGILEPIDPSAMLHTGIFTWDLLLDELSKIDNAFNSNNLPAPDDFKKWVVDAFGVLASREHFLSETMTKRMMEFLDRVPLRLQAYTKSEQYGDYDWGHKFNTSLKIYTAVTNGQEIASKALASETRKLDSGESLLQNTTSDAFKDSRSNGSAISVIGTRYKDPLASGYGKIEQTLIDQSKWVDFTSQESAALWFSILGPGRKTTEFRVENLRSFAKNDGWWPDLSEFFPGGLNVFLMDFALSVFGTVQAVTWAIGTIGVSAVPPAVPLALAAFKFSASIAVDTAKSALGFSGSGRVQRDLVDGWYNLCIGLCIGSFGSILQLPLQADVSGNGTLLRLGVVASVLAMSTYTTAPRYVSEDTSPPSSRTGEKVAGAARSMASGVKTGAKAASGVIVKGVAAVAARASSGRGGNRDDDEPKSEVDALEEALYNLLDLILHRKITPPF